MFGSRLVRMVAFGGVVLVAWAFPFGAVKRLSFRLHGERLQAYFNVIEATKTRHSQWQSMRLAARTLDKFDIPYPDIATGPENWLAFLAHVLVAANDGNLESARRVKKEHGFDRPGGAFVSPAARLSDLLCK